MPHLLEFPEELLLDICRYLSTETLATVLLVCKTLHRIAKPVLYRLPADYLSLLEPYYYLYDSDYFSDSDYLSAVDRLAAPHRSELEDAITYAFNKRQKETLRNLIKYSMREILRSPEIQAQALISASAIGSHEAVKMCLDAGISPEIQPDVYCPKKLKAWPSALVAARENRHRRAAQLLLDAGADPNTYSVRDTVRLLAISASGPDHIFSQMVSKGLDIQMVNFNEDTLLHYACCKGSLHDVRFLLDQGLDPNAQNLDQETPLANAIRSRCMYGRNGNSSFREDLVKLLLSRGADCNAPCSDTCSPLELAVLVQRPKLVKVLIEAGASVTSFNPLSTLAEDFPWTEELAISCKKELHSWSEILVLLLQAGVRLAAGPNLPAVLSMIDSAIYYNASKFLSALMYGFTDQVLRLPYLDVVFLAAASLCDVPLMKRILQLASEKGFEIDLTSICGTTPLIVAARQRHLKTVVEAVRFILEETPPIPSYNRGKQFNFKIYPLIRKEGPLELLQLLGRHKAKAARMGV
ncbi:ankyrin repeat-containing domain protein [Aspergillus karnatakaensis]|uniref:ankyrin repeat domain-containing protein n=1 Tax=Aspergillus karnatakaensis TaxID=1810916 RepID=UPI003CCDC23F